MNDPKLMVAARTEAIEWSAWLKESSDDEIATALGVLNAELEKALGHRLYQVWMAVWLKRKQTGRWV